MKDEKDGNVGKSPSGESASVPPVETKKAPKPITDDTPQSYTKVVLDIVMSERPKTHPNKKGNGMEGYPSAAQILKVLRKQSISKKQVDIINKQVDWRNGGMPNHHVYWLPSDMVTGAGQSVKVDAVYVPIMHQGRVINYNYQIQFTK